MGVSHDAPPVLEVSRTPDLPISVILACLDLKPGVVWEGLPGHKG